MPPLVTVIIPTYNWATVLPYAIESVLAQSLGDFELLVVGDGCTDESEQVVAGITDPRVRWINLPANTGHQSGPNNRGLDEAKGAFIAYLGHDDLWLPHHLASAVARLQESGADIALTMVLRIFPDRVRVTSVMPLLGEAIWHPPSGVVHRRAVTERIGHWRDYRELRVTPEADLWQRAQAAGFRFVSVPRLTAVKFPASKRKNVYRDRPFHEQALWLQRIRSEPAFEAECLVEIIASGEVVRATPLRALLPIVRAELTRRFKTRFNAFGVLGRLFFPAKGAGITQTRTFKGLDPDRRKEPES